MFRYGYFLHTFFTLFVVFFLFNELEAANINFSYEKFARLNKPINRSDSGDWLGLSYESAPPTKDLDTFFMGKTRFYFQDGSALNYSLQEAYVQYKIGNYTISLGRKILDWNTNEKYWSLGFLNVVQSFTLLGIDEEGVTGLIIDKKMGDFDFSLMGSYFFIPQINPSVNFENGQVKSRSEWVRLPPKKTIVNNVEVPIFYEKSKYNVSQIIFNKSLGGRLRFKWHEGNLAIFAIYKPENKLRINASAFLDNQGTSQVIVESSPTVNHHAYYGMQLSQELGDLRLRSGLSYSDPNARIGKDFIIDITNARKTFKSDYFTINPRFEKEAYGHLSLNYNKGKNYKLSLNYIRLLTNNVRGNDDFFSDTIRWKNTLGGGFLYSFNDFFTLFFDLKYDFDRKDNIAKVEGNYHFNEKITLGIGVETLKAPDNNSYWSFYRTNDTVYGNINFSF